ncbi:pyridoxamine 5'-phosphate oxidase family protein [Frankia sp. AiPs1]|uniref:pyridoxamine 5'-phosphate oxidase family protein n=1 Tax=Frankia sp. AiPs1 TaxID=573493 RepID=UPI0020434557|nr:pyridoxamine 5'-phosphate oxidase family protein [Frankia sp. AiPs1]MCM3923202.1 pyridoxamine 5'-phosphate oxidase family protein [Frankia sp. AiPs1]
MTTPTTPSTTSSRTSWRDFESAHPTLAGTVRTRFKAFRHHILATIRADGSPRTSGIEVTFHSGDLWLGSMPAARKSRDLRRDPRFALSANPGPGTDMAGGDVRIAGLARWVDDPAALAHFAAEVSPPEPFDLFRVELTEIVRTTVDEAAEEIVLTSWRPGYPAVRVQRRGNSAADIRDTWAEANA